MHTTGTAGGYDLDIKPDLDILPTLHPFGGRNGGYIGLCIRICQGKLGKFPEILVNEQLHFPSKNKVDYRVSPWVCLKIFLKICLNTTLHTLLESGPS